MNISSELQDLLEASLADGKISKKEKKVLFNRAEKEGIDLNEFEVYIDSLKVQVGNESSVTKLVTFGKWLVQKKRRVIIAFFILSGVLVILNGLIESSEREKIFEERSQERGCDNVDDCLSQYKFNEARQFMSEKRIWDRGGYLRLIISAEVTFFMSNDSEERALSVLREYTFDRSPDMGPYESDWNVDYNEEVNWYNDQLEEIITGDKWDEAELRKLINLLKPIMIIKDEEPFRDYSTKTRIKKDYNL